MQKFAWRKIEYHLFVCHSAIDKTTDLQRKLYREKNPLSLLSYDWVNVHILDANAIHSARKWRNENNFSGVFSFASNIAVTVLSESTLIKCLLITVG